MQLGFTTDPSMSPMRHTLRLLFVEGLDLLTEDRLLPSAVRQMMPRRRSSNADRAAFAPSPMAITICL